MEKLVHFELQFIKKEKRKAFSFAPQFFFPPPITVILIFTGIDLLHCREFNLNATCSAQGHVLF